MLDWEMSLEERALRKLILEDSYLLRHKREWLR